MPFFKYNRKKVFYSDRGKGLPLIIIHGNSVSSRMHWLLGKKLKKHLRIISPDLPGHGKSERLNEWPTDFWYEHAEVIKNLLDHLGLKRAHILGYSGGALIGINFALKYPERTIKLIADSFEGVKSVDWFAENIEEDRAKDKSKFMAKAFWFLMHGRDWSRVVDKDTGVIKSHHEKIGAFFHGNIAQLSVPVLLTGSMKDQYLPGGIDKILYPLSKEIPDSFVKVYPEGSHPACLTVKEYIPDILDFINR